jgi:hypothetical protein
MNYEYYERKKVPYSWHGIFGTSAILMRANWLCPSKAQAQTYRRRLGRIASATQRFANNQEANFPPATSAEADLKKIPEP